VSYGLEKESIAGCWGGVSGKEDEPSGECGDDEDEEDEVETRSMLKKSSKEEGKAKDGGGWSGESTSMVVVVIVEIALGVCAAKTMLLA
jgi:hypothetical protein